MEISSSKCICLIIEEIKFLTRCGRSPFSFPVGFHSITGDVLFLCLDQILRAGGLPFSVASYIGSEFVPRLSPHPGGPQAEFSAVAEFSAAARSEVSPRSWGPRRSEVSRGFHCRGGVQRILRSSMPNRSVVSHRSAVPWRSEVPRRSLMSRRSSVPRARSLPRRRSVARPSPRRPLGSVPQRVLRIS